MGVPHPPGRIQTDIVGMTGEGLARIDNAMGRIVGKPQQPQQDIMSIGAPAPPGSLPQGTVAVETTTAPDSFEETLRREAEYSTQDWPGHDPREDELVPAHETAPKAADDQ